MYCGFKQPNLAGKPYLSKGLLHGLADGPVTVGGKGNKTGTRSTKSNGRGTLTIGGANNIFAAWNEWKTIRLVKFVLHGKAEFAVIGCGQGTNEKAHTADIKYSILTRNLLG